ncbi:MAG TPA: hypothetical protein VN363_00955, partial [Anaerolineales bacterium]|nr:hypothetical protein [Anaerolineales bacterium]
MNTITEEKIAAIRREKPRLGLIFGLLAGAGFALTAWGLDANQLAQAHAYLPWGKFIAGLVICLVVGGFTGWVASRLDSSLWAAFLWALVGCTFTIGLSWLAYKGFLSLFNWFYPDLASQMDYASNPAITLLTGIAVVASGILGIGVGIAQIIQVESALAGVNPFQRLVRLAMGALIFAIAGAISSSLVQTKLAEPVLQVNDALVYAREHRGQILEIKEARKYGLTALRALGDLQYQPYRLVVSSYDEYLSMIWVMLDFGDVQTRCSVLEKTLSYCESPPEIAASSSSGNSVSIPGPQPTGIPSAVPTSTPAGSSTDTASGEQVNPPENIPPPTDPALDSV